MKNEKKGFILMTVIFLIMIVSVIVGTMFYQLTKDMELIKDIRKRAQTLYIAEAGIEDAIYNLRLDNTWTSDGTAAIEFPEDSGNTYAITYPVDESTVQSIATLSGGDQRTVEAELSVSDEGPPYAVEMDTWEDTI